jgi:translation initiation factor 2 alpha subunit (eIF-2alpha)
VLEKPGELVEEGVQVVAGVEVQCLCPQGTDKVDKAVVQVPLLPGRERIGELVLVEVHSHGCPRHPFATESEERRHVQHVGGEEKIGLF